MKLKKDMEEIMDNISGITGILSVELCEDSEPMISVMVEDGYYYEVMDGIEKSFDRTRLYIEDYFIDGNEDNIINIHEDVFSENNIGKLMGTLREYKNVLDMKKANKDC